MENCPQDGMFVLLFQGYVLSRRCGGNSFADRFWKRFLGQEGRGFYRMTCTVALRQMKRRIKHGDAPGLATPHMVPAAESKPAFVDDV